MSGGFSVPIYHPSQLVQNNGVKAVVYGKSGSGKTRLLTTAPRPLILSAERGLLSIAGVQGVAAAPIESITDLDKYYKWAAGSNEARAFDTIGLDSISEIAEQSLGIEKVSAGRDPRRAYGPMIDTVINYFRLFRDLPQKHVVFIAKQERNKDEATGAMLYGPTMPGQKLPQEVPYFFDETWCLEKFTDPQSGGNIERLRCHASNQYEAKDRSGRLAEFEPANLSVVFAKMMATA